MGQLGVLINKQKSVLFIKTPHCPFLCHTTILNEILFFKYFVFSLHTSDLNVKNCQQLNIF